MTLDGNIVTHGRLNMNRLVAEIFVNSAHKIFEAPPGNPGLKQEILLKFGHLVEEHLRDGALFISEIRWGQYLGGAKGRKFAS